MRSSERLARLAQMATFYTEPDTLNMEILDMVEILELKAIILYSWNYLSTCLEMYLIDSPALLWNYELVHHSNDTNSPESLPKVTYKKLLANNFLEYFCISLNLFDIWKDHSSPKTLAHILKWKPCWWLAFLLNGGLFLLTWTVTVLRCSGVSLTKRSAYFVISPWQFRVLKDGIFVFGE